MSGDLDKDSIRLLKYILSNSKNGTLTISLEDMVNQLGMNINDILDALKKLEKIGAIKLAHPPTSDFVLKSLISEASEYDLMYLLEKIDEQTYKRQLEEILSRSSLKDLTIDKSCLTSNIVDLKEALNDTEYILIIIHEIITSPSMEKNEKQKIINDFSNEFLSCLIYINGFIKKLEFLSELVSESLENFKKARIKAKTIVEEKLRKEYEEFRKNVIKKSINFFLLGSILYPEAFYMGEESRKCDLCGKEVELYWTHCQFCGTKINKVLLVINPTERKQRICYNCKNVLPQESEICPKCRFSFPEEIARVEGLLSNLKEELELLNARAIIEGDAVISEIREKEIKYNETKLYLEKLKKAFQEQKYVTAEMTKYLIVNIDAQKFYSILLKKTTVFRDLINKAGLRVDKSFEESVKDILENEEKMMDRIRHFVHEIPLSLQEYDMIIGKDRKSLVCNSCGLKNMEDALFCVECGNRL